MTLLYCWLESQHKVTCWSNSDIRVGTHDGISPQQDLRGPAERSFNHGDVLRLAKISSPIKKLKVDHREVLMDSNL